ncbi:50S ribosomal protein L6 [Candidatus Margulisiibacteriota bacterium]
MSRAGRAPIEVPKGVQVKIDKDKVTAKGPKGNLEQAIDSPFIKIEMEKDVILVKRTKENAEVRAKHGLYRSLIFNMVKGVAEGFEKQLNMVGVGYRAQKQGNKLVLQLGYSHPIEIDAPKGIDFIVEGTNKIKVTGADRQLVGQIAQDIKYCRPVEPYKGKGVHYNGQQIRRKAGKAAKGAV